MQSIYFSHSHIFELTSNLRLWLYVGHGNTKSEEFCRNNDDPYGSCMQEERGRAREKNNTPKRISDLKGKSNANMKHSSQQIFSLSSGSHQAHVTRGAVMDKPLDNSEGPTAQMN